MPDGITPNQILKKTRRARRMTIRQIADTLGVTYQRVSQWENGDPILMDRIQSWVNSPTLPKWTREMACQMWLTALNAEHERLGLQIAKLQATFPLVFMSHSLA